MREIKFRFWNEQTNCMYADTGLTSLGVNDAVEKAKQSEYVRMQFTGLKDKNEKEIYEGDVLSDKWKVEVYQNDEGTYMVKFHTNPKQNKPLTLKNYLERRKTAGTDDVDNCIIGNTYENPELLK